ncbi:hypothetical protein GCM10025865_20970 [Paraoerskovia sediminicola]|uniref:CBM6 domain-containing protein n=1 Tax=Paraoerskovia sediminicola TaxID=1138587 RepID=A0ABM8G436_9CELL|nr:glycosyl hydrolase family 28-related protein [Paraoerskovia sediminicola]BDZ42798.1 hypothetical protein GCM10025865_20970 [Paraoerskovia sediminicola]
MLRTGKGAKGEGYQAEDAFFANGAVATGGSDGDAAAGVDLAAERSRLVVPVNATKAGTQKVTIRYANTGADAEVVLGVDGAALGRVALPATQGWSEVSVEADLRAGLGSVELRTPGTALDGALTVDSVTLQKGAPMAERGATLPYTEYEAEHGITNGEILEPSREFRTIAAEASGRQAVVLDERGDHVEWTLTAPASSVVLRASIPDTADGKGQSATLGLYQGKKKLTDIEVSSEHAWVYGGYPYGNDPSTGGAQRFFDDSRATFPKLPAGATLRLEKDAASSDVAFTVDLIDAEVVPGAYDEPAGFVDVRDHGATPDDGSDDTAAVQAAVDAAKDAGTGVWIPAGTFDVSDRIRVNDVTVRGAGPWHTTVQGTAGKGGFYALGTGVTIADLAVDGGSTYRDDAKFDAAFEGNFGAGSLLQNVWASHAKVGLWADAGTDGLYALGLRVRDVYADGVHLHGAVTDTHVEHTSVRNTGDDAMAMWSAGAR